MTPVVPCRIRRSQDRWRGEMLLQLRNGKAAYIARLPLEQVRMLAVEMRGLASDHCPLHHMTVRIAKPLNAKISHVVIKRMGASDEVTGMMRLVITTGDAHHLRVCSGGTVACDLHGPADIYGWRVFPRGIAMGGQKHDVIDDESTNTGYGELPRKVPTPIPHVFQDLIERLGMPDGLEAADSQPADDEFLST